MFDSYASGQWIFVVLAVLAVSVLLTSLVWAFAAGEEIGFLVAIIMALAALAFGGGAMGTNTSRIADAHARAQVAATYGVTVTGLNRKDENLHWTKDSQRCSARLIDVEHRWTIMTETRVCTHA